MILSIKLSPGLIALDYRIFAADVVLKTSVTKYDVCFHFVTKTSSNIETPAYTCSIIIIFDG